MHVHVHVQCVGTVDTLCIGYRVPWGCRVHPCHVSSGRGTLLPYQMEVYGLRGKGLAGGAEEELREHRPLRASGRTECVRL